MTNTIKELSDAYYAAYVVGRRTRRTRTQETP